MKRLLKFLVWILVGRLVVQFVDRYASDTEFADDIAFQHMWRQRGLVVASSRQEYSKDFLRALAPIIASQVGRSDLYEFWQEYGFTIYPDNFQSPLPNLRQLSRDPWVTGYSLAGVEMGDDQQDRLLREVLPPYVVEYRQALDKLRYVRGWDPDNPYFKSPDAEVLYGLIRHYRSGRVVEVGSGFSTFIIHQACLRNGIDGTACSVIAIDPEPRSTIDALGDLVTVRTQRVESVEMDLFTSLVENDVLFIDSSHVARIGSDVLYECLEIIPRLRPGVLVHFHDIFLPQEYPRGWVVDERRFWNEQYLVCALLVFNCRFEVLWASRYMSLRRGSEMRQLFGAADGGSLWLRSGGTERD